MPNKRIQSNPFDFILGPKSAGQIWMSRIPSENTIVPTTLVVQLTGTTDLVNIDPPFDSFHFIFIWPVDGTINTGLGGNVPQGIPLPQDIINMWMYDSVAGVYRQLA